MQGSVAKYLPSIGEGLRHVTNASEVIHSRLAVQEFRIKLAPFIWIVPSFGALAH
jgi:hypothetical protein